MDNRPKLGRGIVLVNGEAVGVGEFGEYDVQLRVGAVESADVTVRVGGARLMLNVDGNGQVSLWAVRDSAPIPTQERYTVDLWYGNVVTALAERAAAGNGPAAQAG